MSKIILTEELLKEAAAKAMKIECAVLEKCAAQEEEHEFSKEHERRIRELVRRNCGKTKEKRAKTRYGRNGMSLRIRIALVAVVVMMMGSMTVLAVEPLREKVYQMIERIFSDHTEVSFEEIEQEIKAEAVEADMENYPRRLKKVPEGYTLFSEEDFMKNSEIEVPDFTQIYSNPKDQNLSYVQVLTENYSVAITSDGTPAKRIKVGNDEAYLFTDESNYHGIILQKEGFVYTIGGYDDVEVLIDCLESVFEDD